MLTEDDVRDELRAACDQDGKATVAAFFDCTIAYLDMLLAGTRQPGPKVLSALGLRKVISYEKEACNSRVGGA